MEAEEFRPIWANNIPLIVNQRLLDDIEAKGVEALNDFLISPIQQLKNTYKYIGNPRLIYKSGSSICNIVKSINCCNYSFQYSRLQALLAEMLLAYGKDKYELQKAISHLHIAIEIVQRTEDFSDDLVKAYIFYTLLLGVAKKALGHFEESLKDMRERATYLIQTQIATEIDLVPLRRQEIMMFQQASGYEHLAEDAIRYKSLKPLEYYRSLKRVFEFLLNEGETKKAEQIYKTFIQAFTVVSHTVPPISILSFLKNIGQYQISIGNIEEASIILNHTLLSAQKLNLQGQVRQVNRLIQEIESDHNQGKLVTFEVNSHKRD